MSIQSLPQSLIDAATNIVVEGQEYKDFFNSVLKKFGVTSPAELKGDKEKEFYDYIDKNWKGKNESRNTEKSPVGKYQTPKLDESELTEGMVKSKMKFNNKVIGDLKKLEASEKKSDLQYIEVRQISDMLKKGIEVVQDDEGEPKAISKKDLKVFDKIWGRLDTYVRDEIYSIVKKHSTDEELVALLGVYGA